MTEAIKTEKLLEEKRNCEDDQHLWSFFTKTEVVHGIAFTYRTCYKCPAIFVEDFNDDVE